MTSNTNRQVLEKTSIALKEQEIKKLKEYKAILINNTLGLK